jgi:hypothetical protein
MLWEDTKARSYSSGRLMTTICHTGEIAAYVRHPADALPLLNHDVPCTSASTETLQAVIERNT